MAYTDKYGVIFSEDCKELYRCPANFQGGYTIPNNVTRICGMAFSHCSGLTSVTIPNSVLSIGDRAFFGCSGLRSMTIGNSVASIGENAFYGCDGLTAITIPDSVTNIGGFAFSSCRGLTAITIPDGINIIGDGTFHSCSGLTSVTIGNSVTSIGESAFYGCSGLTAITIPDSVTSIGEYAFKNCTGLTFVKWNAKNCNACQFGSQVEFFVFGNEVEDIPSHICSGMNRITSIIIPNSVISIGKSAFYGCSGLTAIIIPDSVTSIGEDAFENCTGLSSVTIPNSVTSIGEGAFSYCTGLTSINVSSNNLNYCSVDGVLFNIIKTKLIQYPCGKQGAYSIPNGVKSIEEKAFSNCKGLTSVTIPNSVTTIGDGAFYSCSGLISMAIGENVISIGYYPFNCCHSLTSINVSSNNLNYCSVDGVLFNKIKTKLIQYPCGKQGAYTIPNSITSIPDNAFYACESLTSLTIPNSVSSIGNRAFYGCHSLKNVIIPKSVTHIDCILGGPFIGCRSLTSIVVEKGNPVYDSRDNCNAIIDTANNTLIVGCEKSIIPYGVTDILTYAFNNFSGLTSIVIPDSITDIWKDGFYNCENLEVVVFDVSISGNTSVTFHCSFKKCPKLNTIQFMSNGELIESISPIAIDDESLSSLVKSSFDKIRTQLYRKHMQEERANREREEKARAEAKRAAEEREQNRKRKIREEQEQQRLMEQQMQEMLQGSILFFDTETTGTPRNYRAPVSDSDNWPRLVQLAWIMADKDGHILKQKSVIIKPDGFSIPSDASNVHGITTERAMREGKALAEVLKEFATDLSFATQVVGHNIDFDQHIVGAELYRLDMDYDALMNKPSVCTMVSSTDFCAIPNPNPYFGGYKWPSLSELHRKLFGRDFSGAHDALADITATKDCFFELKRRGII